MRSLLVPVDGSPSSLRALDYAIAEAKALGEGANIHLVNAQPPVPSAVSDFVGRSNVDDYHREQAEKEVATARQKLTESGVTFRTALLVGSPAESIAQYARTNTIHEIIMGRRGLNRLSGLLLGAVSTRVLALVDQPVTLIK